MRQFNFNNAINAGQSTFSGQFGVCAKSNSQCVDPDALRLYLRGRSKPETGWACCPETVFMTPTGYTATRVPEFAVQGHVQCGSSLANGSLSPAGITGWMMTTAGALGSRLG